MPLWKRQPKPVDSPVLIVDSLGFASRIKACDSNGLIEVSDRLDKQYHRFRAKIPFGLMVVTPKNVFGTRDFSTFRLNDMFVLFTEKSPKDAAHRHVVASLLLYHALLFEGFIPRGGLGYGLVLRRRDSILGHGFMDAYEASEKRSEDTRNICAIQLSPRFLTSLTSHSSFRLLSFYKGTFFLNPLSIIDPEIEKFGKDRVIQLLQTAGANDEKLKATEHFLDTLEDYDTAADPNSESSQFLRTALRSMQSPNVDDGLRPARRPDRSSP